MKYLIPIFLFLCPFIIQYLDVSSLRNHPNRIRLVKRIFILLAMACAIPMVVLDLDRQEIDSKNTTEGKQNTDYLVEKEKERSLQDSIYTYYGIVRDINGKEVEGALIWISLSTETIQTAPSMTTSNGGGFVFKDLRTRMHDTFRVTVKCKGYKKYNEQREILGRSDTITLMPCGDD